VTFFPDAKRRGASGPWGDAGEIHPRDASGPQVNTRELHPRGASDPRKYSGSKHPNSRQTILKVFTFVFSIQSRRKCRHSIGARGALKKF